MIKLGNGNMSKCEKINPPPNLRTVKYSLKKALQTYFIKLMHKNHSIKFKSFILWFHIS